MSLEDKCWDAFVNKDYKEAVRLLPLVKELNKIRATFWGDITSLLHLSSYNGWLDVTKDLITKYHCDPHERDDWDWTCLHWAAEGNHVDVMRYLIDEFHCDPMTVSRIGRTPLHWAARYGNSAAVEYLLSTGKCDPLAKDNNGYTPFQLAKKFGHTDILSVFKKFGGIKSSHPIDSYVNVLLVGNPGAGKSTLSHVIKDTAISSIVLGSFRNVGGVVPCTAGIIPYKLQHRTLGNIILHDFAGHSEYYSSHSAVIENLLQGSGGVFLIVVNILEKEAVKQLHQWVTVVRNEAQKALNECHVIVIVSHVDEIFTNPFEKRRRREEIQEIIVRESNTGIVSVCGLTRLSPKYDPDMLICFLKNMELCEEINPSFLRMTNLHQLVVEEEEEGGRERRGERLFFFPCLLCTDRPHEMTSEVYQFGWCLQCTSKHHFFPPRYFHVLSLRLAYKMALPQEDDKLKRRCTFWKNGLYWSNGHGVGSLVEIVDESQCVLVMMSCEKGYSDNMVSLRRDVIGEVMSVYKESCPSLEVKELVIDRKELAYPVNTPRERAVYSVKDVMSAFVKREEFLVNATGTRRTGLKEILPDESLSDISNLSLLGGRDIKEVIEITEEFKTPSTPIKLGML
uniref:Uncharacterized protein n=1 Tax=Amphimedon queenslandica TaxID=400682 RepID=A0A1X7T0Y3_AMPQE